jgi:hypothetical protein
MEATMANVLHHHEMHAAELPTHVYWAAAIGLALLTIVFVYAAMTGNNASAPATLTDIPFVPFLPIP